MHMQNSRTHVFTQRDCDMSPLSGLLTQMKEHARDYARLVTKNEAAMDQATYQNHLSTVSTVIAAISAMQCRYCAQAVTHVAGGGETCAAHRQNPIAFEASPTLALRQAALRHLAAHLTDEAWDEVQGVGVWHDLVGALRPLTNVRTSDGCEDRLSVCAVCEGAEACCAWCPVDLIDRILDGKVPDGGAQ